MKLPSCTFEELKTIGLPIIRVGETVIGQLEPKEFKTGSYGLGYGGPIILQLPDGRVVKLQASVNLTVTHSKKEA